MTESQPESDPIPKPRGLWSLMSKTSGEPPADADAVEESSAPPRSLFDVMRQASSTVLEMRKPAEGGGHDLAEPPSEVGGLVRAEENGPVDECIPLIIPTADRKRYRSVSASQRTRQSCWGLGSGIASIGLSSLAIRPEVWMSLPASLLGFTAIILGYLLLSSSRWRDHSSSIKWISLASIVTGIVGIFLGPLYFSEWGRELRESKGHNQTRRHLSARTTE